MLQTINLEGRPNSTKFWPVTSRSRSERELNHSFDSSSLGTTGGQRIEPYNLNQPATEIHTDTDTSRFYNIWLQSVKKVEQWTKWEGWSVSWAWPVLTVLYPPSHHQSSNNAVSEQRSAKKRDSASCMCWVCHLVTFSVSCSPSLSMSLST